MWVVHVEADGAKHILNSSIVGVHPIDEIFVPSPDYHLRYITHVTNSLNLMNVDWHLSYSI